MTRQRIADGLIQAGVAFGLLFRIVAVAFTIVRIKYMQRKQIIFIYRTLGIGDIVCAFMAIHKLKLSHPNHVIIFGTHQTIVPLLTMHPDIDIVLQTSDVSPIPRLYRRFFDQYYPLTTAIEGKRGPQSQHLMSDISENFKIEVPHQYFPLHPSETDISTTNKHIAEIGEQRQLLIAICSGPSNPVKVWPIEKWELFVSKIQATHNCTVVQLGAGKSIKRVGGTFDFTNKLDLRESASFISQCDLFVGIDSGLLHIARAVGTRAVGIFGPTLGRLIVDEFTTVVQTNVECTGCHHLDPVGHWNSGCPNDILCMNSLDVDEVVNRVKEILLPVATK